MVVSDTFEWDEAKNDANQQKHGISFEQAVRIFEAAVITIEDLRYDYGERREVSFRFLGEAIVLAVVHTDRDGKRRIISARQAKQKDRQLFYDALQRLLNATHAAP